MAELQQLDKPGNFLQLIHALKLADEAIGLAGRDDIPHVTGRVAAKLFDWYPGGQMLAWGKGFEYMTAGRPPHLLAAGVLAGWDEVAATLKAQRGGLWFEVREDRARRVPLESAWKTGRVPTWEIAFSGRVILSVG